MRKIFAEHREYLCRVVRARMDARLARRLDASDIVQEAQIEALRRLESFLQHPQVPLKIWLRQLVVERLIMAQRKHIHAARRAIGREHRSDKSSVDGANQLATGLTSPSQGAMKRETADQLRASLDLLSEMDREIILLHSYEGLTSQESAAILGIEPAAARKRLGRAVQRLRQALDDRNFDAESL